MATDPLQQWPSPSPDTPPSMPAHPSAPPLNYRGHIVGLDVLRGAAVLVVLFDHAYANTTDYTRWHGAARAFIAFTGMGHLGVHLFFILSGFLITGILYDGRDAAGKARPNTARTFYMRRMRRILPAYLALLIALRLAHLVDWNFILACLLFVVNMGRLVGARLSQFSFVWSLAVEEQFYLVWPWILWRCSSRTVLRTIVACLVLAPIFRLGLSLVGQDSYFKTWVNVDYLMYGALVACLLRSGALHGGNIRRIRGWLYAGALTGILLSVAMWGMARHTVWAAVCFNAVGRTPEIALFLALLLGAVVTHQGSLAHSATSEPSSEPRSEQPARDTQRISPPTRVESLPARSLVFLGYISYGLYLVHMLVYRMYDRHFAGSALGRFDQSFAALTVRALLCSTISILLAWLSRSTVEAWFLRRSAGRRTSSHPGS